MVAFVCTGEVSRHIVPLCRRYSRPANETYAGFFHSSKKELFLPITVKMILFLSFCCHVFGVKNRTQLRIFVVPSSLLSTNAEVLSCAQYSPLNSKRSEFD